MIKESKNRRSMNEKTNPLLANMYVFFEKIPFSTKVINLERKMISIIQDK